MVRDLIIANRVRDDVEFDVVSNPEFLREGNAIQDTLQPDRIIIGAFNQKSAMSLVELYTPLERPIVVTDPYSAEIIKYASNAFLATKISFINAVANICELVGADILQVSKGIGLDKRIGSAFLNAGLGWGGSCFGKDTSCLIATADRAGYDFDILKSVVALNAEQPKRLVTKILNTMESVDGKTIAVLGLAFKPNTDDLRDGKSLEIVSQLRSAGARIRAYDPIAMDNAKKIVPDLDYCDSAYEAATGADAIVLVTEWKEFKFLDLDRLKGLMTSPVIFDGRNMLNTERVRSKGFVYHCIGRPSAMPCNNASQKKHN
jgi:UDPglucose 6-dehydrogenase